MNILELLNNKNFLKNDQFDKREILKKYILTDDRCIIGSEVICFENETIISDKNKSFYKHYGNARRAHNITIGKLYKILEHKDGKIKIESDNGKKFWFTVNRFLYSLNMMRKDKLKKLKNISNE
jgi:hypothetical protein